MIKSIHINFNGDEHVVVALTSDGDITLENQSYFHSQLAYIGCESYIETTGLPVGQSM